MEVLIGNKGVALLNDLGVPPEVALPIAIAVVLILCILWGVSKKK